MPTATLQRVGLLKGCSICEGVQLKSGKSALKSDMEGKQNKRKTDVKARMKGERRGGGGTGTRKGEEKGSSTDWEGEKERRGGDHILR